MNGDGSEPDRLVNMIPGDTPDGCTTFAGRLVYSPNRRQIAFVSDSDHSLYVMNADGSDLIPVAKGAASNVGDFDASIRWSPNGAQLAFAEYAPRGSYRADRLYVVTSDGLELTPLTADEDPPIWDFEWSPDGKQIAYNAFFSSGGGIGRISIVNADGSGAQPLTNEQGIITQKEPAWSPDGGRVLFWNSNSVADRQSPGLNIANGDGSGEVRLAGVAGEIRYGSGNVSLYFQAASPWSADGSRIFFVEDRESGISSLNVINPDGSGLISLTGRGSLTLGPVWSPDRSRFAYLASAGQGQINNLYVLNVAELQPIRLPARGQLAELAWSPDGTRLAYTAETAGGWHLFLINLDGSEPTPLTGNAGFINSSPVWSADGERLFFQSASGPGQPYDIYTVKADGTELNNLTDNPANDFFVRYGGCGG
jgi:Tol biopolymer transport system component